MASDMGYGITGSAAVLTGSAIPGTDVAAFTGGVSDFATGNGVWLPNQGAVCAVAAPSAPTVGVGGGGGGTSSYAYQVAALDNQDGCSAASPVTTLTNAAATLGGLGPDGSGDGYDIYKSNWNNITASVPSGSDGRIAVWRVQVPSGSTLATGFIGMYPRNNTPFFDYGQDVKTPPPGVPTEPPASPTRQSLTTSISRASSFVLQFAAVLQGGGTVTVYHDDTAGLQEALTALGSLSLPAGTFGVSGLLALTGEGTSFAGAGWLSALRLQGNTAGLVAGASHTEIHDLRLLGQFLSNPITAGTTTGTVEGVHIYRCRVEQPGFSGITSTSPAGEWNVGLDIDHCSVLDSQAGIEVFGGWSEVGITNNRIRFSDFNTGGRGISLHNGPQGFQRRFTILGNRIRASNHTGGLVLQGSGGGEVVGNQIAVSGGIFGIAVYGDGTADDETGEVSVVGNHIESLWQTDGVAVYTENAQKVGVVGNTVRYFGYAWEVTGYGGTGALVDSASNYIRITDNVMQGINVRPLLNTTVPASLIISGGATGPIPYGG